MNTIDAAHGRSLALFYVAALLALFAILYTKTPLHRAYDAAPASHVFNAPKAHSKLAVPAGLQGGLKMHLKMPLKAARSLASAR
jgi:hypothetical protein